MTNLAAGRQMQARGREAQKFGRYRLLGRLAIGGMAEVWAAHLVAAGGFKKPMVIKRILPELASNPSFLRMLMSEARVAARLSHANVCSVFELGDVDGEHYIAMEYLRGVALTDLIKHGGPIPPEIAGTILAQACDGLHYAHEQRDGNGQLLGLVHRDVSPHNLLVTVEGAVKVLDFGIAKVDDGSNDRTEAGKVKGKLPYMSPEQLAAEPLDRRSDVWSLGVVLWELLTGKRLFGGASPAFTVDAIRNTRIPLLDMPRLDAVLARALCRNREWRYPNAAEFRRALVQAIEPAPMATAEGLSQLVWARCDAEVRHHDRMFDEEDIPSGVVDRLPLRADATDASADVVLYHHDAYHHDAYHHDAYHHDAVKLTVPEGRPAPSLATARHPAAARAATQPAASIPPPSAPPPLVMQSSPIAPTLMLPPASVTVVPSRRTSAGGPSLAPLPSSAPRRQRLAFALGGAAALTIAAIIAVIIARSGDLPSKGRTEVAKTDSAEVKPGVAPAGTPATPATPTPPRDEKREAAPTVTVGPEASGDAPTPAEATMPEVPTPEVVDKDPERGGSDRRADSARRHDRERERDRDRDRRDTSRKEANPYESTPGRLHVDARPWAKIYLDGKSMGVTPIVGASVSPGEHTIKAVAEDGRTRTLRVRVDPGGEVRRRVIW